MAGETKPVPGVNQTPRGCPDWLEQAHSDLPLRTAADPDPQAGATLYEALQSKGIAVGMVVQSTAGHDYSRLGIVIALRPPFAMITDGRYRPAGKPKKKRLSHLRPVAAADTARLAQALAFPEAGQRDSAIRQLIEAALAPLRTGPAPHAPEPPADTTTQAP